MYRGANSYLLGRIIASSSGLDLRDFLVPRLFGPLGIGNPQWLRCPLGYSLGAVGLQLRTEEIARLGRTLLANGLWQARQLIPADYVRSMATDVVDTAAHRASPAPDLMNSVPDTAGTSGCAVATTPGAWTACTVSSASFFLSTRHVSPLQRTTRDLPPTSSIRSGRRSFPP